MKSQQVIQTIPYVAMEHFLWHPVVYFMSSLHQNWRIEKGSYRIRETNLRNIFRESGIMNFRISRQGMAIYGLGKTICQITSLMEMMLAKIKPLKLFSGYCYMAGRKR